MHLAPAVPPRLDLAETQHQLEQLLNEQQPQGRPLASEVMMLVWPEALQETQSLGEEPPTQETMTRAKKRWRLNVPTIQLEVAQELEPASKLRTKPVLQRRWEWWQKQER
mmetsp:Transcript_5244/g.14861  ORF Transcript_5244/g.14861 Transcript_5244/m.14861 type:complete len:110 (+) Transcript_5244:3248-3577(+)